MTVVYSVSHSDGDFHVATKAEALQAARSIAAAGDPYVHVQRWTVTERFASTRQLYCALLNGESWAAGHEDVWSANGGSREQR
jgi:hypothetical protein